MALSKIFHHIWWKILDKGNRSGVGHPHFMNETEDECFQKKVIER